MRRLFWTMGCVKSKKREGSKVKAFLVPEPEGQITVDPVLLDYAHTLSEEIVSRAVQQWLELDRRYVDIPFIECDVP